MTRVRLPRLLDANFNEVGRAQPTALQISLQLRDASTAQMTVPGGGIGMHAWTELYTHKGSAGLFRVTGITRDLDGADTLTLRHAIDTLSDSVWRAQTASGSASPPRISSSIALYAVVRSRARLRLAPRSLLASAPLAPSEHAL